MSVIIYVRNGARTIERAIQSIIDQDYPNIEFVVVDGQSDDGTQAIVTRYQDYLTSFISEPDRGAFEAANKGVALAKGYIVCFVMADDWLSPGAIRDIARAFVDHPGVGLVSSGVAVVEETPGGNLAGVVERSGTENAFTLDNILGVPMSAARYYRRELFDLLGGFSGDYPLAHDRELLLRYYLAGVKSTEIQHVLYTYRRHEGARTLSFSPHTYRRILEEHMRLAEAYLSHPALSERDHRMLRSWHSEQAARACLFELRSGSIQAAVEAVHRGFTRTAWFPLEAFQQFFAIMTRRKAMKIRRR